MTGRGRTAALLLVGAALAGCATAVPGVARPVELTDSDRRLVEEYFEQANHAADRGAGEQAEFFRRTQHPDARDRLCDLRGLTVWMEPALTTLRPDPDWSPGGRTGNPRGVVYVVAVTLTARREGATLGSQIASKHIAVLDGTAYGFAPCPS
ncbi:hypothetical protein LX15_003097 [Streptoalloteichus tenebrarius]|uniref:Lipoprotein n=1 Tax=Streptoalloteichus tenebrarius (strain ATCC 17920 / DSM 40477 / JCM 4838 / CBS 697.72 / NBRC 16177 / NCIMB 11028 / NRRL B-12390 / A12253. 1 / ISP 5477) TaxID=1933 RepID=A0ABT1HV49_STRSD|nr:hypothetical protein [Streptoalloteichus tenebrarius]MCP2259396.1 hypothetical protein [Streptoalloteichus tenebrarius]BFF02338.1 hypothetical protein GCM10020241_40130 [Streptoalloteichus tenebrarius]